MPVLQEVLDEARTLTDAALQRWLPGVETEPRRLHEAMRYVLFAGGKRLRPAVALAACRAAGGRDEDVLPCCCAIEMVHAYSLIHDDLPAIDDDDLRRGRPTCHRRFDEATAILTGDALHTEGFRILAERIERRDAVPDLVAELAAAAGSAGMVGGELADIEAEGEPPELERVEFIHRRKTAALFVASAVMGGIAAGADGAVRKALRRYGEAVGLGFQIIDDVLDETGDAETLGKSPGKDRRARKMTYPAVVGLEASHRRAQQLCEQAERALAPLADAQALAALARYVASRAR